MDYRAIIIFVIYVIFICKLNYYALCTNDDCLTINTGVWADGYTMIGFVTWNLNIIF